jgi:hypothetical protein
LAAVRARLDGVGVQTIRLDAAGQHRFSIDRAARAVRFVTNSGFSGGDRRRLGAAVTGIALDGAGVALDDDRLATGWHEDEGGLRWTDGAGLLLVAGVLDVQIDVCAVPFVEPARCG